MRIATTVIAGFLAPLAFFLVMGAALSSQAADGKADEPRGGKAFKGIELYSWKNSKGEWVYVLALGTNRIKEEAEIKENKSQHLTQEKLLKEFKRLAVGEYVSWIDAKGFEHPPVMIRKAIEKAAADAELELHDGVR